MNREVRVQLPAEPPALTPEAARVLLRMIKAASVYPCPVCGARGPCPHEAGAAPENANDA